MDCPVLLQVTPSIMDIQYLLYVVSSKMVMYIYHSQRLVQRLLVRLCACEWDWSGPGDRSLSCAVWVAGSMSIPVHSLSPVLKTALLNSAERMLHRDLSVGMDSDAEGKVKVNSARMLCNTLWGLAKSGFRWDDLSTSLQEAISESVYKLRSAMNSADVG